MKISRWKGIVFSALLVALSFAVLELVSLGALIGVVHPQNQTLIQNFPPQFRVGTSDRYQVFSSVLAQTESKPLRWNQFEFDPAMGFRDTDFLTWFSPVRRVKFGEYPKEGLSKRDQLQSWAEAFAKEVRASRNPYVIVTLGGSTTATNSFGLNWPAFLGEQAQAVGFKPDVFVLNAGTNGFSSFQNKIYLTGWVLPLLKEVGVQPQAVLSLDGVNDFLFGIQSHYLYEKEKLPFWFDMYHGYHQLVARDVTRLQSTSPKNQSILTLNRNHWAVRKAISATTYFLPYTSQVLLELKEKSVKRQPKTELLVTVTNPKTGDSEKWYYLPESAEKKLVASMSANLVDLLGESRARGAVFATYLQPVFLEQYAPGPLPEPHGYDGIRCSPKHINEMDLGGDFFADWGGVYQKAEAMYLEMNQSYPGSFINLASLFKGHGESTNYHFDTLHYSEKAMRLIAKAVMADLKSKGSPGAQFLTTSTL